MDWCDHIDVTPPYGNGECMSSLLVYQNPYISDQSQTLPLHIYHRHCYG